MNFSNPQESPTTSKKELYVGKGLFSVAAVNPTKEELKAMNQYVPEDDLNYTFKRELNGKSFDAVNISVYLKNVNNSDHIEKVTYTLIKDNIFSNTNKFSCINKYGEQSWLEQANIDSKEMPDKMEWYLPDGLKKEIRGEKQLVAFIRALRNFKKISKTTDVAEREKYASSFEDKDLDKMFNGDFTDIKSVIMSRPDLTVGFLLGVRTNNEGKRYTDVFKEYPLRRYMVGNETANEYIIAKIQEAQGAGSYANTYFDLSGNLAFGKFDESKIVNPDSDQMGMFEMTTDFNEKDHDDLPF